MNIKNYKYAQTLLGKTVHFVADCDFFPKNGIHGKVIALEYSKSNELLYIVSINGKRHTIGANTKGLSIHKCYS